MDVSDRACFTISLHALYPTGCQSHFLHLVVFKGFQYRECFPALKLSSHPVWMFPLSATRCQLSAAYIRLNGDVLSGDLGAELK